MKMRRVPRRVAGVASSLVVGSTSTFAEAAESNGSVTIATPDGIITTIVAITSRPLTQPIAAANTIHDEAGRARGV
ncbi:MAG: hypothetical protein FJW22_00375 [Acidimicrobiia bacterium]|nr:hypothetical protein [Acidimicrobiia bacterium]